MTHCKSALQIGFCRGVDHTAKESPSFRLVLLRNIVDLRIQLVEHGVDGLADFCLLRVAEGAVLGPLLKKLVHFVARRAKLSCCRTLGQLSLPLTASNSFGVSGLGTP